MLDKTYEFLYETQNQKRPSFFVFLGETRTMIVIAIVALICLKYDFYVGMICFAIYLWWSITRSTLLRRDKLTSKKNFFSFTNSLVKRFYERKNTALTELLAKKILIEKKDENR